MKRMTVFAFMFCFLILSSAFAGTKETSAEEMMAQATVQKLVLILGSYKDFAIALDKSKEYSQATAIPYSDRDMFFDKKRGWIFRDTIEDEIYAGTYYHRRSNLDCGGADAACISIEKSETYEGMSPGYYILIASINDLSEKSSVQDLLKNIQKVIPDAYLKKTPIYMGCTH